ncbi:hypothetical protein BJ912DRAFT_1059755 [Pholiota molesta]|nr:hypothetical protein BJ912DRAFT_1059755 [Pholiota molesta]
MCGDKDTTVVLYAFVVKHQEATRRHLARFKAAIQNAGPNAEGQLRPNPGWLPLHPDQRRGHEAPARLNTQHRTDGTHITRPHASGHHQPKKAALKRPASDDNLKHASTLKAAKSYHRIVAGLNNMSLRERKGQPPPPPSPAKVHQPAPVAGSTSNLRPGHTSSQDTSGNHPRMVRGHPTWRTRQLARGRAETPTAPAEPQPLREAAAGDEGCGSHAQGQGVWETQCDRDSGPSSFAECTSDETLKSSRASGAGI